MAHGIAGADVARLDESFTFRDRPAVLAFLDQFPSLLGTLLTAADHIHVLFPDAQVALDVITDYDASEPEDRKILVASIVTRIEPSRAIARLNELYTTWWFQVTGEARKRLSFGLESI